MQKITTYLEDNQRAILYTFLLVIVAFTFAQRYPMDDAFISFRYAKFAAAGEGLVWNIGERVEGYTNFLWTILIAGGIKLGIEPERFSLLLSFPCLVAAIWMTFRLARHFTGSGIAGLLAMLIVGFNRSVYAFATSGLETTLQMAEFLAIILLLSELQKNRWETKTIAVLSSVLGISLLTRLDSGIPLVIVAVTFYNSQEWRVRPKLYAALLPLFVLVAPWLIWKYSFYGSLLPNSYLIKVEGFEFFLYGLFYLHLFGLAHLLHAQFLAMAFSWRSLRNLPAGALESAWLVVLWMAYTAYVGGDFMEFRFLVPIIPILIALLIAVIMKFQSVALSWAMIAGLALGTIQSNFALDRLLFGYGVESVWHLRSHLNAKSENWVLIGKKLKEYYGGSDLLVSVGAAGAIPYYSELRSIDFLGLTDKEIALNHEPFTKAPGHRVISSLDYLVDRGANIIIEPNNHLMNEKEFEAWERNLSWREADEFYLNPDGKVNGSIVARIFLFAMPIDNEHRLVVWYLTPHPLVDKLIAENQWQTFTISRW